MTSTRPLKFGMLREDLKTLSKNEIIARLGPHDLGPFLDMLDEVAVVPGAVIVDPERDDLYMYVILEGEAVVRRGDRVLRRLAPGDHFGEISVLGMRPRSASVHAETTMRLARLSRSRFQSLASVHPAAALHTLQAVIAYLGSSVVDLSESVARLSERRRSRLPLELRVRVAGADRVVAAGVPIGSVLPSHKDGETVLLALLDNKPLPLQSPMVSSGTVAAMTVRDRPGREAWQRSAQLLFLEAAGQVAPGVEFWMEAPFDGLSVARPRDAMSDPESTARAIQSAMARLVESAQPFIDDAMTVDEARVILMRQGWTGAASLQRMSREWVTTLSTCGVVHALSTGPFVPNTDCLDGFSVHTHPNGLLLDCGAKTRAHASGDADRAAVRAEQDRPRFFSEMAMAHRGFLGAMGVDTIGAFNDMCVREDVGRLVRVAEAFHEKQIGKIAEHIADDRERLRVVAVAGPSSSGKTTFIRRLSVQLEVSGIRPVYLSLDDYYVDRDLTPKDETGDYDFELVTALDLPRLRTHLRRLVAGETVRTSRYDFKSGKGNPEGGPQLTIGRGEVLLVEGIHALNDAVWPDAFESSRRLRVFVHPSVTLPLDRLNGTSSSDARLLRRIVRDRHQRSITAADNIQRWNSVRRGERKHIYPAYRNADTVFDTSLAYELAVLKVYAERYLLEVPEDHASFAVARRLRQLVEPIVAVHPEHVPSTSLLREFIGGSGFA